MSGGHGVGSSSLLTPTIKQSHRCSRIGGFCISDRRQKFASGQLDISEQNPNECLLFGPQCIYGIQGSCLVGLPAYGKEGNEQGDDAAYGKYPPV